MTSAATNRCAKCGGDIGFEIRVIEGAFYHPGCAPIDWDAIHAETVAMQERERIYGPGGLRDQFAAAALTGMLSNYDANGESPLPASSFAIDAYVFADAMLKQRKKEP